MGTESTAPPEVDHTRTATVRAGEPWAKVGDFTDETEGNLLFPSPDRAPGPGPERVITDGYEVGGPDPAEPVTVGVNRRALSAVFTAGNEAADPVRCQDKEEIA